MSKGKNTRLMRLIKDACGGNKGSLKVPRVRGPVPDISSRPTNQFAQELKKSIFSSRKAFGSKKAALEITTMREAFDAKRSSAAAPRITAAAMVTGPLISSTSLKAGVVAVRLVSPQYCGRASNNLIGEMRRLSRSSAPSRTSNDDDCPSKLVVLFQKSRVNSKPGVKVASAR